MKRVLSIGQCAMDHGSIKHVIESQFDAQVSAAHDATDALSQLRAGDFQLVLVNRVFDADGSDGLRIVEQMKADPQLSGTPVMLVTNYPEYQDRAVAAGAEPGFGKSGLRSPETRERLAAFLE
jgi:two-component system chemotaxis response regulator CheY